MDDNGTRAPWPAALERRMQERIRLLRGAPTADFISQMIAERSPSADHNETMGTALVAYEAGGRIAVRRMPAGYRKTVVA